ncbi:MAG: purine-nucleoside phosphorylase [Chloroflexi bacterium RBG_19FT_COMBO_50_10]|nr:MAG: purine-nucleoside phosphorylase [Chloroflexi bacterium RBG_19FT_COMBO_50_10]
MSEFYPLEQIDRIADFIRSRTSYRPQVGIILGSGLGALAASVEFSTIIPYNEIPEWPVSTVIGHQGHLVIGKFENKNVIVMQGRVHYYEGYSMAQVALPVRVLQRLGIEILIVTNAAGAVNPNFSPGELMLITDQINMIGMAGLNPLRGPNLEELGARFPDMSQAFDPGLMELARKVATEEKINLQEGVYICLAGPSFETPADLRFLSIIGADSVGMSTVPEVITARHGGTRVLGISGISNKANLDGETITSHQEVLEAGQILAPKLTALIGGVLRRL